MPSHTHPHANMKTTTQKNLNDFVKPFPSRRTSESLPDLLYTYTSPHRLEIRIRPFQEADLGFVVDSWLRSYRTAPESSGTSNDLYFNGMRARVGRIAERAKVLVACLPTDAARLLGFICYEASSDASFEQLVAHYIYVKRDVRRRGIAEALGAAAGFDRDKIILISHENHNIKHLKRSYDIVYDSTLVG